MSKAQNTVIWLGLILITLNLLVNIGELKSVLFGSGGASKAANIMPTNNASTPPQTSTPEQTPPSVQTPSGVQAV